MAFSNPYTEHVYSERTRLERLQSFDDDYKSKEVKYHVKGFNNLNKTWGPWSFDLVYCGNDITFVLYHEACGYDINLAGINSTADILDWMLHMSGKSLFSYGEDCLYFLGQAFKDILKYGKINIKENTEFNGLKVARKYYKGLSTRRSISAKTRHLVLERDDFRCCDCGASPANGALLEVDHTIPVSKGGTNDLDNLRTLCSECNRGKSDRIVTYSRDPKGAPRP